MKKVILSKALRVVATLIVALLIFSSCEDELVELTVPVNVAGDTTNVDVDNSNTNNINVVDSSQINVNVGGDTIIIQNNIYIVMDTDTTLLGNTNTGGTDGTGTGTDAETSKFDTWKGRKVFYDQTALVGIVDQEGVVRQVPLVADDGDIVYTKGDLLFIDRELSYDNGTDYRVRNNNEYITFTDKSDAPLKLGAKVNFHYEIETGVFGMVIDNSDINTSTTDPNAGGDDNTNTGNTGGDNNTNTGGNTGGGDTENTGGNTDPYYIENYTYIGNIGKNTGYYYGNFSEDNKLVAPEDAKVYKSDDGTHFVIIGDYKTVSKQNLIGSWAQEGNNSWSYWKIVLKNKDDIEIPKTSKIVSPVKIGEKKGFKIIL